MCGGFGGVFSVRERVRERVRGFERGACEQVVDERTCRYARGTGVTILLLPSSLLPRSSQVVGWPIIIQHQTVSKPYQFNLNRYMK